MKRFYNLPPVSNNGDRRMSGESLDRSPLTRRKRIIAEIMAEDNRPPSPCFVNPHNEIYRRSRIPTQPEVENDSENVCSNSSVLDRPQVSRWRYLAHQNHTRHVSFSLPPPVNYSASSSADSANDDSDDENISTPATQHQDITSPPPRTIIRPNTPKQTLSSIKKLRVPFTNSLKDSTVMSPSRSSLPPRKRPQTCLRHSITSSPPSSPSTPPGRPCSPTRAISPSKIYPVSGTNPRSVITTKPNCTGRYETHYRDDPHNSEFHKLVFRTRNNSQFPSHRPPSGINSQVYSRYQAPPPTPSTTAITMRAVSSSNPTGPARSMIFNLINNLEPIPAEDTSNMGHSSVITPVDEGNYPSLIEQRRPMAMRSNRPVLPSISESLDETFGDCSLIAANEEKEKQQQQSSVSKDVFASSNYRIDNSNKIENNEIRNITSTTLNRKPLKPREILARYMAEDLEWAKQGLNREEDKPKEEETCPTTTADKMHYSVSPEELLAKKMTEDIDRAKQSGLEKKESNETRPAATTILKQFGAKEVLGKKMAEDIHVQQDKQSGLEKIETSDETHPTATTIIKQFGPEEVSARKMAEDVDYAKQSGLEKKEESNETCLTTTTIKKQFGSEDVLTKKTAKDVNYAKQNGLDKIESSDETHPTSTTIKKQFGPANGIEQLPLIRPNQTTRQRCTTATQRQTREKCMTARQRYLMTMRERCTTARIRRPMTAVNETISNDDDDETKNVQNEDSSSLEQDSCSTPIIDNNKIERSSNIIDKSSDEKAPNLFIERIDQLLSVFDDEEESETSENDHTRSSDDSQDTLTEENQKEEKNCNTEPIIVREIRSLSPHMLYLRRRTKLARSMTMKRRRKPRKFISRDPKTERVRRGLKTKMTLPERLESIPEDEGETNHLCPDFTVPQLKSICHVYMRLHKKTIREELEKIREAIELQMAEEARIKREEEEKKMLKEKEEEELRLKLEQEEKERREQKEKERERRKMARRQRAEAEHKNTDIVIEDLEENVETITTDNNQVPSNSDTEHTISTETTFDENRQHNIDLMTERIREYYRSHSILRLPPIEPNNIRPTTCTTRCTTITQYGPPLLPVIVYSKDEVSNDKVISTQDNHENDVLPHRNEMAYSNAYTPYQCGYKKRKSRICRLYSRARNAVHNAFSRVRKLF